MTHYFTDEDHQLPTVPSVDADTTDEMEDALMPILNELHDIREQINRKENIEAIRERLNNMKKSIVEEEEYYRSIQKELEDDEELFDENYYNSVKLAGDFASDIRYQIEKTNSILNFHPDFGGDDEIDVEENEEDDDDYDSHDNDEDEIMGILKSMNVDAMNEEEQTKIKDFVAKMSLKKKGGKRTSSKMKKQKTIRKRRSSNMKKQNRKSSNKKRKSSRKQKTIKKRK